MQQKGEHGEESEGIEGKRKTNQKVTNKVEFERSVEYVVENDYICLTNETCGYSHNTKDAHEKTIRMCLHVLLGAGRKEGKKGEG